MEILGQHNPKLAARLRKASKARNLRRHPDSELLGNVIEGSVGKVEPNRLGFMRVGVEIPDDKVRRGLKTGGAEEGRAEQRFIEVSPFATSSLWQVGGWVGGEA